MLSKGVILESMMLDTWWVPAWNPGSQGALWIWCLTWDAFLGWPRWCYTAWSSISQPWQFDDGWSAPQIPQPPCLKSRPLKVGHIEKDWCGAFPRRERSGLGIPWLFPLLWSARLPSEPRWGLLGSRVKSAGPQACGGWHLQRKGPGSFYQAVDKASNLLFL